MQKSKLVTFGCSFTFGSGLPDCCNNNCLVPSNYAWPSILGKELSLIVDNQSLPGSSNFEILQHILKYNFCESDIAVIMWTLPDRDLVFKDSLFFKSYDYVSLGSWDESMLATYWKLTHNKTDLAIRSWFYIHHASTFLAMKNIRLINIFASYKLLKHFKPKFLDVKVFDIEPGMVSLWKDYANDKIHPGIKSHRFIATQVGKLINEN
jgi:hypothetical protein